MSGSLSFDIKVHYPDFSLEVAEDIPLDGITALTGPSGSGKTSLLRVLAGLETQGMARVRFGDETWDSLPPHKRGIGYVFQDSRLFEHLDVAGNLAFGAMRNRVGQSHVDAVVEALKLSPLLKRRCATLSGGELRRVALGRALAARPRILFLDEPLSGLDPRRKTEMLDAVSRACSGFRIPALFVTHIRTEVHAVAHSELRLRGGRVLRWARTPASLTVKVVTNPEGQSALSLDGRMIPLPRSVKEASQVRLGMPEGSYLLSRHDPGVSNALVTLPVIVRDMQSDGVLTVTCMAQDMVLNASAQIEGVSPGDTLFLTLIDVTFSPLF